MPSTGLVFLANAIANQEGYGQPGAIPTRSNNPGDLKNSDIGNGVDTNGETIYSTAGQGQAALYHQLQIISDGTSPQYNALAQSMGLDDSSQLTLAQVGSKYASDPNWAAGVGTQLGVDPTTTTVSDITSGNADTNSVAMQGALSTQNPPGGQVTIPGIAPVVPITAQSVSVASLTGSDASAALSEMQSTLQIDQGLDETPWYSDPALLTGNPRVRQNVQPMKFVVYLDRKMGQMLHNPNIPQSSSAAIELQLNTSVSQFNVQSKHVYNRQPSRTGMHVTFWGMQPDLITGSGTTGVFMNQFGITDFFSVATINDDVQRLVTQGFTHMFMPTLTSNAQGSTGTVITSNINQPDLFSKNVSNVTNTSNPAEAFRVAAQDAFVEFMKLFQMNGNIWYHTNNYSGNLTGKDQVAPNAWSPNKGITSFQQHGRNNDVMGRGYVSLKWRNAVYLGYFKSLNWTQDAEKPFQWSFNFTFQVERTYAAVYQPNFSQQVVPTITSSTANALPTPLIIPTGDVPLIPSAPVEIVNSHIVDFSFPENNNGN